MRGLNIWDRITAKYLKSIKKDENADFAYQKLVNSLSILSLCYNEGKALDLGCGDGRFTKELEARYDQVFGIDRSEKLIKRAKQICLKTKFIKCDLEYDFPEINLKFDLVVCKLLLMYIKNIDNIAQESFNVLNPGGLLVISVTHPLKWISEQKKGNINNKLYKGYLSETDIFGFVAGNKDLGITFINRTFETYVNTFTKYGFILETVSEIGAPDSFVIKYPNYLASQGKPYQLNMRFVKK